MCLGMPGQILSIEGSIAIAEFWGIRKPVKLEILTEPVQIGDYIVKFGMGPAAFEQKENMLAGL